MAKQIRWYPLYAFYVVFPDGKIGAGNEYREDAKEAARDLPREWGKGKIYTLRTVMRMGIEPSDPKSWKIG